jgi:hypothetical protein
MTSHRVTRKLDEKINKAFEQKSAHRPRSVYEKKGDKGGGSKAVMPPSEAQDESKFPFPSAVMLSLCFIDSSCHAVILTLCFLDLSLILCSDLDELSLLPLTVLPPLRFFVLKI